MKPRDVLGAIAVVLLAAALLTGSVPTALLGGALLTTSVGNADRASLRHHARDAARDTEGPLT